MDYRLAGENIRKKRKELGLTQAKVAEMIDITTSFYSHIENGSRHASIETFIKIAQYLGMPTDCIFNGAFLLSNKNGV